MGTTSSHISGVRAELAQGLLGTGVDAHDLSVEAGKSGGDMSDVESEFVPMKGDQVEWFINVR